jgi:hypothetical protein
VNFRSLFTVLTAALLLFVIETKEIDVPSHELIIANFDTATTQEAQVIIARIKQDLFQAGISDVTLEPSDSGNLLIRYESNLSPAVVLELFSSPSSKSINDKSVHELLGHADLAIVFKDAANSQTIPYGCDGTLSIELKTDIDRQATKRLLAFTYVHTNTVSTRFRSLRSANYLAEQPIYTKSNVFVPDSRAGPLA